MSDFVHLSQVHSGPNVLVVHPATPYKTVADVVDFAKKNPGKLDYGFTHAASGHMAMELFKQTAGIELTGIPYKGGGPMLIDLLAGVIPTMFINQDAALAHVRSGKMRAIAVSSAARNPLYPDVPTISESGYKGFEALSWSGMSVAKGTRLIASGKRTGGGAKTFFAEGRITDDEGTLVATATGVFRYRGK